MFFHKFFNQKQEKRQLKKDKVDKRKSGNRNDSDLGDEVEREEHAEDSDSDKEEAEIWKASPCRGLEVINRLKDLLGDAKEHSIGRTQWHRRR